MSTPRIRVPRSAAAGEEIEIRTLLDHPMTTGLSAPNPRNMMKRFVVQMNGDTVLQYDYGNGSAANPTVIFHLRIEAPGNLAFTWTHEDGREFRTEAQVQVS